MSESSGSINVQQIIEQITGGTVIGVQQIISQLNAQEKRNRQIMLQKVREFWVEGVLEKSLHREVLIELGIQAQNEAVIRENPWSMIVQQAGQPDFEIPPGADISGIAEVFDRSGRALLILGAPGSGKTTTMLTLARDLISRAEADETHAIPVVFNLSSWANERKALAEWLKDELFLRYQVPKKVAAAWVEGDFVLPLLDGLDEVKAENRNECVEAINKFRAEHGHTDVVVCSRIADYEALTSKLKLGGAVTLQALTMTQVEEYLAGFGDELAAVRTLLKEDEPLQELVESPLLLSIMTLAYWGKSAEELKALSTVEVRRKHLFDAYVQSMFKRRVVSVYPQQETVHWLCWLARKMVVNKQSVFYIESLQPSWLDRKWQHITYANGFGLVGGLVFGLVHGLIHGLLAGLIGALFVWGLFGSDNIKIIENISLSVRFLMKFALLFGPIIGVAVALIAGLDAGLILGLLGGLVFGLIAGLNRGENLDTRRNPNQGIQNSLRNGLTFGLGFGLAFGLIIGVIVAPVAGPVVGLFFGLLFGLIMGGGIAVIQHAILRLILWRADYAPLNYARFLDYCAERVILRKVGGGYIFIHRLLLEYFAELNVTKE